MKTLPNIRYNNIPINRQRGLVLFFALIALVVMSLAAVGLVRSVDTSTLIAGNLAFRQSATSSTDLGIEAAALWLKGISDANAGLNVMDNPVHPFNTDSPASGYYSYVVLDSSAGGYINLFDKSVWTNANTMPLNGEAEDVGGNKSRYIIQRMCRTQNTPVGDTANSCLYNKVTDAGNSGAVGDASNGGSGSAASNAAPQTTQLRITVRTTGPRNTVSYAQAFVY